MSALPELPFVVESVRSDKLGALCLIGYDEIIGSQEKLASLLAK